MMPRYRVGIDRGSRWTSRILVVQSKCVEVNVEGSLRTELVEISWGRQITRVINKSLTKTRRASSSVEQYAQFALLRLYRDA